MHPHGTGKDILPGGFVVKVNETTGVERMVLLEHEKGYFWAFKVRGPLERQSERQRRLSESERSEAKRRLFQTERSGAK